MVSGQTAAWESWGSSRTSRNFILYLLDAENGPSGLPFSDLRANAIPGENWTGVHSTIQTNGTHTGWNRVSAAGEAACNRGTATIGSGNSRGTGVGAGQHWRTPGAQPGGRGTHYRDA